MLDNYILGITDEINLAEENESLKLHLINCEDVKRIIRKRSRDSHKGTYGRIGMVSGSKGMAGAAVLNLNSALRSGAGLVKGFIPNEIYTVVESMSLEAITSTFDENNFSYEKFQKEIIEYSSVVATGSGCANLNNYVDILNYLLNYFNKPLVIDAEGLNVLNLEKIKKHKQNIILTPHYGEMAKLLKTDIEYIRNNIVEKAVEFTTKYNVYLVLKGARTVISCPNGKTYINTTGNPGMATAGSGDVLTGIITSFIGQKFSIEHALIAAVYLHGLAGDIGVKHLGEYSLTANDLIKYLPNAIMSV